MPCLATDFFLVYQNLHIEIQDDKTAIDTYEAIKKKSNLEFDYDKERPNLEA